MEGVCGVHLLSAAAGVKAALHLYHKAALSEMLLVSGSSKRRAAPQLRMRAQSLSIAQAESLPPRHNPKHLQRGRYW